VSASWERLVNEPILDIHPYQPGKPIEEVERELGTSMAVKRGVIVRPMASFGLTRALRITVGVPEDNARLIDGLRAVLGKGGARS
jgi:histidinol-phosphate/aromatic aminotransferase/cobyric acid decarboxylase-like protein